MHRDQNKSIKGTTIDTLLQTAIPKTSTGTLSEDNCRCTNVHANFTLNSHQSCGQTVAMNMKTNRGKFKEKNNTKYRPKNLSLYYCL